ncbi:MAG: DUF892 family protein, partial [Saprospiraceae bacterium]|nr:DUF892 family protein [Saprospiraceae bacterium]
CVSCHAIEVRSHADLFVLMPETTLLALAWPLGEKAQAKKCDAMEGIVKEGEGVIEDTEDDTFTRDVGLIVAAQKVEHYEITTYGSLVQLAITLGEQDIADLLATTLQEEKETDAHLTQIAENDINWEAKAEGNGQTP